MKNFLIPALFISLFVFTACKKSEDTPAPAPTGYMDVFAGSPEMSRPYTIPANTHNTKAIARDHSGNVYVVDDDGFNKKILKIDPYNWYTTEFNFGFSNPTGLAVNTADYLFVADAAANKIYRVTPDGMSSVWAGTGDAGFEDGPLASATFNQPTGLAIDADNNMYVTDRGNKAIRKISADGIVSTYLSLDHQLYDGVQETEQLLNSPYGIAVDAEGIVYVTDSNTVLKITTDLFATKAFKGHNPFKLNRAIAVDTKGNLYVSDVKDWSIRKINKNGYLSRIFREPGGYSEDDLQRVVIMKACYGLVMNGDDLLATSEIGPVLKIVFSR